MSPCAQQLTKDGGGALYELEEHERARLCAPRSILRQPHGIRTGTSEVEASEALFMIDLERDGAVFREHRPPEPVA